MAQKHSITETPTGRSVAAFAHAVGYGRTSIYELPPELQPQSIKLGRRRIIVEQPADWLQRVGRPNGEAAR